MNVTKRDNRVEEFDTEKIHEVLFWATEDIKGVTVSDIEIKIAPQFFDGISTKDIQCFAGQLVVTLKSEKKYYC